jgi:tetratricopeptide (TPR) repeat protein
MHRFLATLLVFFMFFALFGQSEAARKTSKGAPKQDKAQPAQPAEPAPESKDPEACQRLLQAGNAKFEQKDPTGASAEFQNALKVCPEPCASMTGLGLCSYALGNKLDAIVWIERAAACNPDNKDLEKLLVGLRQDLDRASKTPVKERTLTDEADPRSAPPSRPSLAQSITAPVPSAVSAPRSLPAIEPTESHDGYYVGQECDIQGCAPLKVTIQGEKIEGAIYEKDGKPFIFVEGTLDHATGAIRTTYKGSVKLLGFTFELKGACSGRLSKGHAEGKCKGTDAFEAAATFSLDKRSANSALGRGSEKEKPADQKETR